MKLLVLDVEGTIFKTDVRLEGTTLDSTIWQSIAQRLGRSAIQAEVETHARWGRNEYPSYLDWMKATLAIHEAHGLRKSVFDEVVASADYQDGVVRTMAQIDRSEYEPVLISGGFRELARRAQADLRIDHAFAACEYLFNEDGTIAGRNLLPCDFDGKIDFIRLMLREYRLSDQDWIFVGDGLNDVPLARVAPLSIAFRAHPDLQQVCTHSLDRFDDILEILQRSDLEATTAKT